MVGRFVRGEDAPFFDYEAIDRRGGRVRAAAVRRSGWGSVEGGDGAAADAGAGMASAGDLKSTDKHVLGSSPARLRAGSDSAGSFESFDESDSEEEREEQQRYFEGDGNSAAAAGETSHAAFDGNFGRGAGSRGAADAAAAGSGVWHAPA
jgi:hypothetical protein